MDYKEDFFSFIENSPTAYQAVDSVCERLSSRGFTQLSPAKKWDLRSGEGYYVKSGGSSAVAFIVPREPRFPLHFSMGAAHSDSPAFRIKENPEIHSGPYITLNTEGYGGMIMHTWMDRPLSVAGRLIVKKGDEYECVSVNVDRDLLVIPSVAIHLDPGANSVKKYNRRQDMPPLFAMDGDQGDILSIAARKVGFRKEDIAGYDLFLCPRQKPVLTGSRGQFITSPRLDDLTGVFALLCGLLSSRDSGAVRLLAVFDNEEVGSLTRKGAGSVFLRDTVSRIGRAIQGDDFEMSRSLADSFMLSADNRHAVHPNARALRDPTNRPVLNGGPVIKYAYSGRYVTDGLAGGILKGLMAEAGIKYQLFFNRSDLPGGATLGNISNTHVPLLSADVGLAQLAMHSAVETMGWEDLPLFVDMAMEVYSHRFTFLGDGRYRID